ncbi:hypothetical protein JAAARDRAFT_66107 [Jaapia argillacea MUCL 33604]|uniref:Nucleoside diphosphate kinase n=1 Tax=Jaapia argillacea MUCL 33604 TaxID=933084 RepID=A0A067QID6_9AGAM|nr:hypothetical protein JAAARDRAFT_66107 [Jaapia argillacea MUCL 33604]
MSGSSPHSPASKAGQLSGHSSPSHHYPTRTVAIIKNHALDHRLELEPRIIDAGFEIVKERQMDFDMDADPDVMYELFGEEAHSFAEGPVWVYVLERRGAVQTWNELMGPSDPEQARATAPHTLRALYGLSSRQNGFMGSQDVEMAEIQIASLFVSSPPFPTHELPPDDLPSPNSQVHSGSMRSASSSILSALRRGAAEIANGKSPFKARPLPSTTAVPSIKPRTSRAAQLRAGLEVEKAPSGPRAPLTKEQLAKTFANVPGHKRAERVPVASTAPPVVAPRMTRAASLRIGKMADTPIIPSRARSGSTAVATSSNKSDSSVEKKDTFEGVPGHKRRESFSVASTKAPTVAPKMNRSAALRAAKEVAPPSSFNFRGSGDQQRPTISRSNSRASMSGTASRPTPSRPASQASISTATPSRPAPAPRPSTTRTRTKEDSPTSAKENGNPTKETPAKPKPRLSSLQGPTIAPRSNKSALLRAAKMLGNNNSSAPAPSKTKAKPKPVFV